MLCVNLASRFLVASENVCPFRLQMLLAFETSPLVAAD